VVVIRFLSSRGEHCGRSDLVNNKVARSRVRALFTGLLRCAAHDKGVCLARDDNVEITVFI